MIEVKQVGRKFGTHDALRDVTITVEAGDMFGLIGPNGAGKTTLIRILATILPPTTGHASVGGKDVVRHPAEVRRRSGYMPD